MSGIAGSGPLQKVNWMFGFSESFQLPIVNFRAAYSRASHISFKNASTRGIGQVLLTVAAVISRLLVIVLYLAECICCTIGGVDSRSIFSPIWITIFVLAFLNIYIENGVLRGNQRGMMQNEYTLWLICSFSKCTHAAGPSVYHILTISQCWPKPGCSSLGPLVRVPFFSALFNVLETASSRSLSKFSLMSYHLSWLFCLSLLFTFVDMNTLFHYTGHLPGSMPFKPPYQSLCVKVCSEADGNHRQQLTRF